MNLLYSINEAAAVPGIKAECIGDGDGRTTSFMDLVLRKSGQLSDPKNLSSLVFREQAHGDAVIDEAPMLIISNYHVTVFLKEVSMFKISAYGRLNLFGGINSSQLHALVGSGPCMKPLRCST
ncbi:TPA: hypothetical protein ACH3X1_012871 [Trebouxia sp. C0004]